MTKLTHKEEEVMSILWQLKNAFVKDILAEMGEPKPPYNTVSSIVRKLEAEGHIDHEAFGKTHRYFPVLQQSDYRSSAFSHLMATFFDGSPKALLSHFVEKEKLDVDELTAILEELKRKEAAAQDPKSNI